MIFGMQTIYSIESNMFWWIWLTVFANNNFIYVCNYLARSSGSEVRSDCRDRPFDIQNLGCEPKWIRVDACRTRLIISVQVWSNDFRNSNNSLIRQKIPHFWGIFWRIRLISSIESNMFWWIWQTVFANNDGIYVCNYASRSSGSEVRSDCRDRPFDACRADIVGFMSMATRQ